MNKKNLIILIGIALIALIAWQLRSNPNAAGSFMSKEEVKPSDVVIVQTIEGYNPQNVTISKGQRVVWVNESDDFIWPASNLHPTHEVYPEFDPLEPIEKGKAWGFVFKKSGEWAFHDHIKPSRRGTIKVTE